MNITSSKKVCFNFYFSNTKFYGGFCSFSSQSSQLFSGKKFISSKLCLNLMKSEKVLFLTFWFTAFHSLSFSPYDLNKIDVWLWMALSTRSVRWRSCYNTKEIHRPKVKEKKKLHTCKMVILSNLLCFNFLLRSIFAERHIILAIIFGRSWFKL